MDQIIDALRSFLVKVKAVADLYEPLAAERSNLESVVRSRRARKETLWGGLRIFNERQP
jgi:hypothetical protein